jgi:hypothetical protein
VDVILGQGWEKRVLAEEELGELRRLSGGMRKFPVRLAIATAFAAVAAALRIADKTNSGWGAAILAAAGLALTVAWGRWFQGRKIAAKFAEDARSGWVARAMVGELTGTEILPVSGARWIENGSPAAWRASAAMRYR